jgi:hypothetical protein
MRIPFVSRSSFLAPIAKALGEADEELRNWRQVLVTLSPQGYNGVVEVEIARSDRQEFIAHCNFGDVSRFPVRIRAAATALRDRGFAGRFLIAHKSGLLRIARL